MVAGEDMIAKGTGGASGVEEMVLAVELEWCCWRQRWC